MIDININHKFLELSLPDLLLDFYESNFNRLIIKVLISKSYSKILLSEDIPEEADEWIKFSKNIIDNNEWCTFNFGEKNTILLDPEELYIEFIYDKCIAGC